MTNVCWILVLATLAGCAASPLPGEPPCGGLLQPCCGEQQTCDEPWACIHDANYDTTFCTGKL